MRDELDITPFAVIDSNAMENAVRQMEDAVRQIVSGIGLGLAFDSHFVISQILKHDSDAYIHFAVPGDATNTMHGRIAELIRDSGLVVRMEQEAWSDTIHGKPGTCALWRRTA